MNIATKAKVSNHLSLNKSAKGAYRDIQKLASAVYNTNSTDMLYVAPLPPQGLLHITANIPKPPAWAINTQRPRTEIWKPKSLQHSTLVRVPKM